MLRPVMRSLVLLAWLVGCGDNLRATPDAGIDATPDATPDAAIDAFLGSCVEADLPATLAALPGVTSATEIADCGPYVEGPARCFLIGFQQTPELEQRLWLTHRGCDRPTVIADWGYSWEFFYDDELATLYKTNSLWVEHRYQGTSLPAPENWDWTQLTIDNGAEDLHDIITAFRMHYAQRWVSTGASKGGITAIYHAYRYPDDLDGTIPYVAPGSRARIDTAYQDFLNTSLPSPCGQGIRDAQVAAVTTRRTMMISRLSQIAPGSETLYLEYMVGYLDWAYWQYFGVEHCFAVPTATSTDDAFWDFIYTYSGFGAARRSPGIPDDFMSNGALSYEWLTEQGFALQLNAQIRPYLVEPIVLGTMEETFVAQFPDVTLPPYDGRVTAEARAWARDLAENMLLVYGAYDPWSGGSIDAPVQASSARFFVPDATHGAQITDMAPADVTAALAHATRMLGVAPVMQKPDRAKVLVNKALLRDRALARHWHVTTRGRLR